MLQRLAPVVLLALLASNHAGAAPSGDFSGLPTVDSSTCTMQHWPKEALKREHQGVVTMGFLVARDGAVLRSEVLSSSGDPLLDGATQAYFATCRFLPALAGGQPVERWGTAHYVWSFEEPGHPDVKKFLRSAADRGDAPSQYALGFLLVNGNAAESVEARDWLHRAAALGHAMAQYQLGDLYQRGLGTPMDLDRARAWFGKAAAQGNGPAQDRLRDLGGAP